MDDEEYPLDSSSDSKIEAAGEQNETYSSPVIPAWLNKAVVAVHKRYPDDLFLPQMVATAFDPRTGSAIAYDRSKSLPSGENVRYRTRIRCADCPLKFFDTGPGRTLENFETHLRSRVHRENVAARRRFEVDETGSDDTESEDDPSDLIQDSQTPVVILARKTADELMKNVHYTISRNATCNTTVAGCTSSAKPREGMQRSGAEQDGIAPSEDVFRHFAVRNRRALLD